MIHVPSPSEFVTGGNAEVDWDVAEAIGLQSHVRHIVNAQPPIPHVLITSREWDEIRGIEHLTCEGDVAYIPFQPSTDLNAAFAAAEKAGLWNEYGYCQAAGQHVLSQTVPVASWGDTIAHATTPTLAICAAVLRLKSQS